MGDPFPHIFLEREMGILDNTHITAGQMSAATPDIYLSPYEAAENMAMNYYQDLETCVDNHKRLAVFKDQPHFYVCVQLKKEKMLSALGKPTIRRFFIGLLDCPKPHYGMNLYKYHKAGHALEEIWLMPDPATCKYLYKNKNLLEENQGEYKLLQYYLDYKSGKLYRRMKELNNELEFTPQLKKNRKD